LEPGTLSIFLLVPDLSPHGEAAPARLLAAALPRERFHVALGVLGPADEPAAEELRGAGAAVHSLPIRHFLDVGGARRLRQVIHEAAPAVVHAWGPTAARLARLVVAPVDGGNVPRLVVSAAADPGSGFGGWLATRIIRRADRIVAATWAEGERYRRLRVSTERLTRIAPAAPPPAPEPDRAAFCRPLNIPPDSRIIVTGGKTEAGGGVRDAFVAFEMLRYQMNDLYLVVCGAGPEAAALEQYGRSLAFDDYRIRFVPDAERAAAVRLAAVAWVTRARGGVEEALGAMAAGKPMLGWENADLAEVVEEAVTGFLVPPGDRAALAEKTRNLLSDPGYAGRIGGAGRSRAAERFAPDRMVEQFARVYAELAGV
jgi:glycosyltransferase involved in cell wall biosynthesis